MKLKITIEDKTYDVEVEAIEPETTVRSNGSHMLEPAALKMPIDVRTAPAPAQSLVDEEKVCRSPISGVVVSVKAQPGQNIQNGDVLLVLEAMKMETNITAPRDGKVSRVTVQAGDAVQNGQVVVEFEAWKI